MKLTQAIIAHLALPPGKSEAIFFDDDVPGFGLRLRAGGSRTYIVQYGIGSRQRRMTIGSPKILDAAKARNTARDLLAKVRLGNDPAADRAESRVRAADEPFGQVIDRFLTRQKRRLRQSSYSATHRYLKSTWKTLHPVHVARITRAAVAAGLGKIADDNGPVSADRARAALSAFFSWAIGEGLCDLNPVIGTNKHFDGQKSRDRVLSDHELMAVWRALPDSDYGAIVKLLIFTGQRREEIGSLQWQEISFERRLITLLPNRTKNCRLHDVPLSSHAVALLSSRVKHAGREFVFGDGPRDAGGNRESGFQGWSKAKAVLDEKIAEQATFIPWRLHDIRRTVATRMADLGVSPHVIEAVVNHVSGHKAGVAGVYNRSSYSTEKAAALEMWGRHVVALIANLAQGYESDNIVNFPASA